MTPDLRTTLSFSSYNKGASNDSQGSVLLHPAHHVWQEYRKEVCSGGFSCQNNQKIVIESKFSSSREAVPEETLVESVTGSVKAVDKACRGRYLKKKEDHCGRYV